MPSHLCFSAALLALACFACDDGATEPVTDAEVGTDARPRQPEPEPQPEADAAIADAAAPVGMGIGPEGGEVSAGGARLIVPAGALAGVTEITIAVEAPDATTTDVYDFGPDGLAFEQPATLIIDLPAGPPTNLALAVWEDGAWMPLPAVAAGPGQIAAEVAHFSRFGVIEVPVGEDPRAACGLSMPIIAACDAGPVPSRCEEYYSVVTPDEVDDSCDGTFEPAGCATADQDPRVLLGICRPMDAANASTATFVYSEAADPRGQRAELDGAISGCEARGLQFCQVIEVPEPEPEPEPGPEPMEGPNACVPDGFTASCPFPGANSCTDHHQGFDAGTLQQVCNGEGGNPSYSDMPCDPAGAVGKCESASVPGQNCTTSYVYPPSDPAIFRNICQGRWTDL